MNASDEAWQFRLDKIFVIATNRGERDIVCRQCGCISDVEECDFTPKGKQIRCDCPHCNSYVKMMRQESLTTVFDFNSRRMYPITECTNALLLWYLNHPSKLTKEKIEDIRNEIEQRKRQL